MIPSHLTVPAVLTLFYSTLIIICLEVPNWDLAKIFQHDCCQSNAVSLDLPTFTPGSVGSQHLVCLHDRKFVCERKNVQKMQG